MEPVELLLNMAAAMTERTTLIYVRVAAAAGGGVSEVEWGGKDVPPSPVCQPASLSACLSPLPASFFIYCSLLGCVNLDASGWSDSECCSPPLSLSLSLLLLLSFSVCLGLAWLGSARIQSLLPWATIEIMDFMCHKLLLMQQSNIYDDNSRWQWWR